MTDADADEYMIIHIEIPYNYDYSQDIEVTRVKNIFIGKKSSTPNYEYINCKKFEINTDALDKLDSNNYNITIKEYNKSDDSTDNNNNDINSNADSPPPN